MADDNGTGSTDPNPDTVDTGNGNGGTQTGTDDAAIAALAAREKAQGRRSGEASVLETLGFKTLDEAKAARAAQLAAEEAQKDEITKARDAATQAAAEAATARAEAAELRTRNQIGDALDALNVTPQRRARLIGLAAGDLTGEADFETVKAAAAALAAEFPEFFTGTTNGTGGLPASGGAANRSNHNNGSQKSRLNSGRDLYKPSNA